MLCARSFHLCCHGRRSTAPTLVGWESHPIPPASSLTDSSVFATLSRLVRRKDIKVSRVSKKGGNQTSSWKETKQIIRPRTAVVLAAWLPPYLHRDLPLRDTSPEPTVVPAHWKPRPALLLSARGLGEWGAPVRFFAIGSSAGISRHSAAPTRCGGAGWWGAAVKH